MKSWVGANTVAHAWIPLGLQAQGGVVRVSMAHYNTAAEIGRQIQHLDEVLP